ncbi:MAG: PspC domain-containing protein [Acidimicrobiales bacterium]
MLPPIEVPRVPRSADRVIAGVAGSWAERWGVEPTVVRASLGLLTLAGGLGAILYGVMAWRSTAPIADPADPSQLTARNPRRELAIGAATAAILLFAREMGLWPGDGVMVPAASVAIGVAVVWTRTLRGDERAGPIPPESVRALQVVAGIALLGAGVISLASRTGGLGNLGASASAIAVVVGGLVMLGAPGAGRVLRNLDEERSLRIREDERAAVAAHLHDSVLQSLVLIQRNDDPRAMVAMARRQERELRSWLYGGATPGDPATVHAAITAMTTEVEADHDVRVEAVIVGDQPLDDAARSLVAALREAVVNAARHARVERVDVFVEADETELTGYVRDTGVGFDQTSVPDDRRGIADSIVGRVRRAGGTATVVSKSGSGTEVELRIPRGGR